MSRDPAARGLNSSGALPQGPDRHPAMSHARVTLLVLLLAALAVAGCVRPRPQAAPAPPPLEVPAVPPHVIAALPDAPEDENDVVPPGPAPRRVTRPARPRPRPAPVEAAKEPATQPLPEPAEPARSADPAPVLRTPETADDSEAVRRVRDALSRASGQLARVNAAALGADARAQYDTARRFIDQAEGALLVRNYMFASYLADKAETLARGLAGR